MISRIWRITLGGAIASTASALLLSRIRTGSYAPGVNCTAHWVHGNRSAKIDRLNASYSLTGVAANAAAVFFWGWFYDKALGRSPTFVRALSATAAIGPVSYLVDYKATPTRFTLGWELVFSRRDMAAIYLSMVIGMFWGAFFRSLVRNKLESSWA